MPVWPIRPILGKKKHMKKVVIFFSYWYAFICHAQTNDSASRLAASYFKETETASRGQHIWKEQVYGPMMFVDPVSRQTYANMPDSAGILKPDGPIFSGVLPNDVLIANTAIHWAGKLWSVMLWPLPTDRDERVNLMEHESFHRTQDEMGLPGRSPTADDLSTMYGRIYFLLELQALKAALSKPVNKRAFDLTNALKFREKRRELFPATFPNERILEMNEGLAEYTGVILGRPKDSILQHLYYQVDTAGNRKSFIRSSAYITGPVYGYLLFQKYPRWTLKVDSNSDFPSLIAKYYHITPPRRQANEPVAALEKKYNGESIIRSEKLKEEKRRQIANDYTDLFNHKPVLTITLVKVLVEFNPNTLFDLGEYGTVYPTADVKDTWGELTVNSTGMLMKDWKVITLPAGEAITENGRIVEGPGWKITLKDNWRLVKLDGMHYGLVNNN